jgi:hypothetical protein
MRPPVNERAFQKLMGRRYKGSTESFKHGRKSFMIWRNGNERGGITLG